MGNLDPNRAQRHSPVKGALAAGSAVVNATPVSSTIILAGASRVRIYWKSSGAGTLDLYPLKPDLSDGTVSGNRYATKLGTAAILAATENTIDADLHGEHAAALVFTPGADGTITYCDVARV